MKVNAKQAAESLREIERARGIVSRHSENNGTVQLVWGVVIVLGLAGFDVFPRLAQLLFPTGRAALSIGPIAAALFIALLASVTSIWMAFYIKQRPVRPLRIENKMLFLFWGFYHSVVIVVGTFGGLLLSRPPFWFTGVGLLSAAPLLITGWRMRQVAFAEER